MAEERVVIIFEERGSRVIRRNIDDVAKSSDRAANQLARMNRLINLFAGGVALRRIVSLVDAYTLINNRLKTVVKTSEQLRSVQEDILRLSNETRTSVESNVDFYARLVRATETMNLSNQDLLRVQTTLNKAIIVSGANAKEASAGLLQLSQALGAGRLFGQELRSVLLQIPIVAKIIARELDVPIGQLKRLGAEGKITSEVIINALKNASSEFDEQFAKTQITIGQSFTVFKNNLIQFVGRINESSLAANTFGKAIIVVSENLEVLSAVIGTALLGNISKILSKTRALALFANPWVAAAAAIAGVGVALFKFRKDITVTEDKFVNLADFAKALFGQIKDELSGFASSAKDIIQPIIDRFVNGFEVLSYMVGIIWSGMFGDLDRSFEGFVKGSARTFDVWLSLNINTWKAILRIGKTFGLAWVESFINTFNLVTGSFENFIKFFIAGGIELSNSFLTIVSAIDKLAIASSNAFVEAISGNVSGAAGILKDASDVFEKDIAEVVGGLAGRLDKRFRDITQTRFIPALANPFAGEMEKFFDLLRNPLKDLELISPLEEFFNRVFDRSRLNAGKRVVEEAFNDLKTQIGNAETNIRMFIGGVADKLRREYGGEISRAVQQVIKDLQEQQQVLLLSNRERERSIQLSKIETKLKKEGQQIVSSEALLIDKELQRIQVLKETNKVLDSVTKDTELYEQVIEDLTDRFNEGIIAPRQYHDAMKAVRRLQLEGRNDPGAGLLRGLDELETRGKDIAGTIEKAFVGAFESSADAFAEFVVTGKLNSRALADAIISDLLRIAARQAALSAFAGLISVFSFAPTAAAGAASTAAANTGASIGGAASVGGAAGAGGAAAGFGVTGAVGRAVAGFRALGGPVQANQPYMVGERGREIFVPDTNGRIVPTGESSSPVIEVHVYNVVDAEEIVADGLKGNKNNKVIVNKVGKNRTAMKQVLN